jgi:hypothetical protein
MLGVTANDPHAEVGEDGEEDEEENGGHIIIVSENSRILEIVLLRYNNAYTINHPIMFGEVAVNKAIASLALIKVNLDDETKRQDFIDNFVPFIATLLNRKKIQNGRS